MEKLGAEIGAWGCRVLQGPVGPWVITNGGAPKRDSQGRSITNAPTSSLTLDGEKPLEVSSRRKPLTLL